MAVRPWRRTRARFGIKLGGEAAPGKSAIAWAVVETRPAPPREEGEVDAAGADAQAAALLQMWRDRGEHDRECQGVTLYRYACPAAFLTSHASADGLTWQAHNALVRRVADRLRRDGVPIEIHLVGDSR